MPRYLSLVVAAMSVAAIASVIGASAQPVARAQAPSRSEIPRTPDGKPDFSGIWQTLSAADYDLEPHAARKDAPPSAGVIGGDGRIPYLPSALEQRKKNYEARDTLDPRLKCFALGVPRAVYYPGPFQIFQRPRDITLLFQFGHPVRTIHTNGTTHPDGVIDFWLGDSRATWDGDTLVVDVVHLGEETWLDRAGNFHSDALHVVERWRYLDRNTIEYKATLEDSKVYARPWSITILLYRHLEPGFEILENYCYTFDWEQYYPYPTP